MKKRLFVMLGLAVATIAGASNRVFVLTTAGDVPPEIAARVRDYLQTHAGAEVRLAPPASFLAGESLEVNGRAAAQLLGESDFGVVVLVRPDTDQPQGVCLPHERFGILNIARLEEGATEDQLVRRAGQDGLRVLSMLLDMSPCPFPLCVLTGFEKTSDLDRMSGTYCPPCQDRFHRLARRAGVPLIEPEKPLTVPIPEEPPAGEPEPTAIAPEPAVDAVSGATPWDP